MPIVKGTAMWAQVNTPDTKWEPCWKIDLLMPDEEADKLKAAGIKVKRNDDGVYQYKFKRKVTNAKGGANKQPVVVDKDKNPTDVIIGNGSTVAVLYKVFTWKFRPGIGADLDKIQILELVEYTGSSEDFPDTEGEAPTTSPSAPPADEDF